MRLDKTIITHNIKSPETVRGVKSPVWGDIIGEITQQKDLTDFINELISDIKYEKPSLEGYATEQWVEDKGYLTEHQDLSGYVEKSEINDFVSITELENSLQPYATKEYVDGIINELNTITLDILS